MERLRGGHRPEVRPLGRVHVRLDHGRGGPRRRQLAHGRRGVLVRRVARVDGLVVRRLRRDRLLLRRVLARGSTTPVEGGDRLVVVGGGHLRGGARLEEALDLLRDRSDHHRDLSHRPLLRGVGVGLRVEGALLHAVPPEEEVPDEGNVAEPGADRARGALGAEALPLGEPGLLPLRQEHRPLLGVADGAQRASGDQTLGHRGPQADSHRGVVPDVPHDARAEILLDAERGVLGLELGLRLLRRLVGRGERRADGRVDHRLGRGVDRGGVGGGGVGGVGGRDGVHRLYLT